MRQCLRMGRCLKTNNIYIAIWSSRPLSPKGFTLFSLVKNLPFTREEGGKILNEKKIFHKKIGVFIPVNYSECHFDKVIESENSYFRN